MGLAMVWSSIDDCCRLRLREENVVPELIEAGCFRYDVVALVGSTEVIPVRLTSFAQGDDYLQTLF